MLEDNFRYSELDRGLALDTDFVNRVFVDEKEAGAVKIKLDGTTSGKVAIGTSAVELLEQISEGLGKLSDLALQSSLTTVTVPTPGGPLIIPINNASAFVATKVQVDLIKRLVDTLKGTL